MSSILKSNKPSEKFLLTIKEAGEYFNIQRDIPSANTENSAIPYGTERYRGYCKTLKRTHTTNKPMIKSGCTFLHTRLYFI